MHLPDGSDAGAWKYRDRRRRCAGDNSRDAASRMLPDSSPLTTLCRLCMANVLCRMTGEMCKPPYVELWN